MVKKLKNYINNIISSYKIQKNISNRYEPSISEIPDNYPDDMKAYLKHQNEYAKDWCEYSVYKDKITENYSFFINTMNLKYLEELEKYSKLYIEKLPRILESLYTENDLYENNPDYNRTIDDKSYYSFVFKKLCMAYEKNNQFDKAIEICEYCINENIIDDGTKSGFIGRLNRLEKKVKNTKE